MRDELQHPSAHLCSRASSGFLSPSIGQGFLRVWSWLAKYESPKFQTDPSLKVDLRSRRYGLDGTV